MLSWLPCSPTSRAGTRVKRVTPRFTTIHIINTITGRPLQPIRTRASTWSRQGPTPRRWPPGVTRKTLTTWWVTIRTRGTIIRGTDSHHLHMTATKNTKTKKNKKPRQEFYLTISFLFTSSFRVAISWKVESKNYNVIITIFIFMLYQFVYLKHSTLVSTI